MRPRRVLAIAAAGALAAAALAGVALSLAALLLTTAAGQRLVLPHLLDLANAEIAGRLSVAGFSAWPGNLEIRGLALLDPEGKPVAEVERIGAALDLSGLGARRISVRVEIDRPRLELAQDAAGRWNIDRALTPRRPRPPEETGPFEWTVRLARLALRGGEVEVRGPDGEVRAHLRDLAADARGLYGPRGGRAELALRGALALPEERPVSLELEAAADGPRVTVPLLRAAIGEATLDLVAEGEPAARRGRVALLSLQVNGADARPLAPAIPVVDVAARAYGEADGRVATLSLEILPGKGGGGSADASAAVRLPPAEPAAGFDVRLDSLDPSRLAAGVPPGSVTLRALGGAAGRDLASLAGAIDVSLAPSRLRGASFGPVAVRGRAGGGVFEVERLQAALPGASITGRGAWRLRGPVSGALTAEARDLGAMARNLSALAGLRLPHLSGSARIDGELRGTAEAPAARIQARSPRLSVEDLSATDLVLDAEARGPRASPWLRVDASAGGASAGGLRLRGATLRARLEGSDAEVALAAVLPAVGAEPFAARASGRFGEGFRNAALGELSVTWPGSRFDLAAPARIDFDGPRVDRLELRSGTEHLVLEGGIADGLLDLRASGERLDLARLPAPLLPASLGLAGRLSFAAEAKGRPAAPRASLHAELSDGAARGLSGIDAAADASLDGSTRRARAAVGIRGLAGAELEVRADAPLDLARARPGEPIALRIRLEGLRIGEALRAAGVEAPLEGTLGLAADLQGTAGAPAISLAVSADGLRYGPYPPLSARLTAEDPGERLGLTLSADLAGARAVDAEGSLPLDLAELARDPGRVLRALGRAPLQARASIPGLDLAALAGKGGFPAGLAGTLAAELEVRGSAAAPRGSIRGRLAGASGGGWRDLGADFDATAEAKESAAEIRVAAGGREVLRAKASLALPPERLGDEAARDRAALRAEVRASGVDLAALRGPAAAAGIVDLRLDAKGTPASPAFDLDAAAKGLALAGRPVGDLEASARAGGRSLRASADLAAAAGGKVRASLDAEVEVSRRTFVRGTLGSAPARAALRAEGLDLSFLAALAPGVFRSASGKLDASMDAEGPLAHLRPRGTVRLAGGRAHVVGAGEWHDIGLDASVDADSFRISRLAARRGRGWVEVRAEAHGLARPGAPADLSGTVGARGFPVSRGAQDLVTLDLDARVTGKVSADRLDVQVTVPSGTARLPKQIPRALQDTEPRKDIQVGPRRERAPAVTGKPFLVKAQIILPGNFHVRREKPRVNLDLRGDVTFTVGEGPVLTKEGDYLEASGTLEPVAERLFRLRRAKVEFPGGEASRATLDAAAVYDHPLAKVTMIATGPAAPPVAWGEKECNDHGDWLCVRMASQPPYDEEQINMLLYTGRTEMKAGAGAVGTLTGQEAGSAALGLLSTQAIPTALKDRLPLDTVAVDAGQLRAGKYVSEKIYVGYTRRYSANPEQGQNQNELQVEVQLSKRWIFESRYGDANTGSASLLWTKDY